jgi:hypothetical protein
VQLTASLPTAPCLIFNYCNAFSNYRRAKTLWWKIQKIVSNFSDLSTAKDIDMADQSTHQATEW